MGSRGLMRVSPRVFHSSLQVSWKYVQVLSVQGVGNYAGIAEIRLLEASVTLSTLEDRLNKGFHAPPPARLAQEGPLSLGWLAGPQPHKAKLTAPFLALLSELGLSG